MEQKYRKKISFLLRLSGWLCLVPAYTNFFFWQNSEGEMSIFFLAEVIIVILFAAFVLSTSKADFWDKSQNLLKTTLFAFVFVSIIISIPLFIAYKNCRKMNE